MKSLEIQQAVYALLTSPALSEISGVTDDVTPGQPMPYISFGSTTDAPDDLLTERGEQATLVLHIWDSQPGFARIKRIMAAVDARLHGARFALADSSTASCRREMAEVMREQDSSDLRRGILRYRITV